MSSAELLAQWDGLLIIPADSHRGRASLVLKTAEEFIPYVAICLVILPGIAGSQHRLSNFGNHVFLTSLVMSGSAVSIGMIVSYWHPNGLNQSPSALSTIAGLHPGHFLKEAQLAEVVLISDSPNTKSDTVLIDCRTVSAFRRGTIRTAINLPIDATVAEETSLLEMLSPKTPLILFCQSRNCEYDELVARRLIGRGFENIRLYDGGYQEWMVEHSEQTSIGGK
ncbi:MAG: rhodanese-like domain-containing protein [Planctomyces sp.]|nr:rhodanese-like domain-containing protein [Planctomyces sp.]